jgi:hypothetical protein
MVWYIANNTELDLKHLSARLKQNCSWMEEQNIAISEEIDGPYIKDVVKKRIEDLNIDAAKRDVEIFIRDRKVLDLWSKEFFESVVDQIRLT